MTPQLLGNCFWGEGRWKSRWPDRRAGKWGVVVSILTLATTGIGQAAPGSKGGPQPPAPAKAEKQSPDEVAAGMALEKRSTKEITAPTGCAASPSATAAKPDNSHLQTSKTRPHARSGQGRFSNNN